MATPRKPARQPRADRGAGGGASAGGSSFPGNMNGGIGGNAGGAPVFAFSHPDPLVTRALQLRSFEKGYVVEEFISNLSDKLVESSKASSSALDPIPFIQTFSPALDQLLALRKQVSEKTEGLEREVKLAEGEYATRLRELDGGFDTIGSAFSALETKVSGVGRTAVRIGEQLESLHLSRSLAQSTALLLSYYLSLSQPPPASTKGPDGSEVPGSTPLEALFATRTSRDGRNRLAVILRRLTALSKDVQENILNAIESLPSEDDDAKINGAKGKGISGKERQRLQMDYEKAGKNKDEVEKYGERFEKECLRLFDRSYRKGDVRMMAHCAKVLQDYNGGMSCVQMYVNQHDFFISKDRILQEAEDGKIPEGEEGEEAEPISTADIWETVSDPDAPPPASEPGLRALAREIRVTVGQEAQIIQAVFPMKDMVMKVFLQRVFAQVIQQHLENLFSRAAGLSSLALLRMLRLTHSFCSKLVEDLKQYDFATTSTYSDAVISGKGGANQSPLATMLDQAMEEIFLPFLEGQRYVELETKWLTTEYKDLLTKYTRYHESVMNMKPNTLLDRVVNQLASTTSAAKDSTPASSAAQAASAAAAWLNKYSGGSIMPTGKEGGTNSGTATPVRASQMPATPIPSQLPVEEKVWEVDGVLTLPIAEKILKWHAEAIGRVVELSAPGELPRNTFTLAKVLADNIGRNYLELYLDSGNAKLEATDNRIEPEFGPIQNLKQVDQVLHLWQRYQTTASVPLVSTAVVTRREMLNANATLVKRIEGKVNKVVQKSIDALVTALQSRLTKQKRDDFRPKNDDLSFARTQTEPCTACCEAIERFRDAAKIGLSGANLEAVLVEVGVAFHSLLLDHFKRFPVNPTGGLMLTKDLAAYQDLFQSFHLGSTILSDRYDMLRQLGNSFIVQPDVLKTYLTESYLGRIDMRLLRPYLMQRSDWPSFSRSFAIGPESDEGPGGETGTVSALPSSTNSQGNGSGHIHTPTVGLLSKGSRLSMGGAAGMGRLRDLLKDVDRHAFGDTSGGGGGSQQNSPSRPTTPGIVRSSTPVSQGQGQAAPGSASRTLPTSGSQSSQLTAPAPLSPKTQSVQRLALRGDQERIGARPGTPISYGVPML